MKKIYLLVLVLGLAGFWIYNYYLPSRKAEEKEVASWTRLAVSSPSFENDGEIPQTYTCNNSDISPPLEIVGVPENAGALAISVNDLSSFPPNYNHWLVWNIDPETKTIAEDTIPPGGVVGKSSYKIDRWNGPCPPLDQKHRYQFTVYVLSEKLDIPPASTESVFKQAIKGKIIGVGRLYGFATRTKQVPKPTEAAE